MLHSGINTFNTKFPENWIPYHFPFSIHHKNCNITDLAPKSFPAAQLIQERHWNVPKYGITEHVTAPDAISCLNQASSTCNKGRAGEFPEGRPIGLKQLLRWWLNSPWAPGHICGVSIMLVFVVVLLFLVLVQGVTKVSDQSRTLEDRNDSNNSLEVCTT